LKFVFIAIVSARQSSNLFQTIMFLKTSLLDDVKVF